MILDVIHHFYVVQVQKEMNVGNGKEQLLDLKILHIKGEFHLQQKYIIQILMLIMEIFVWIFSKVNGHLLCLFQKFFYQFVLYLLIQILIVL
ncbi:hypothetical protein Mgra_00008848 [Meloidogyne graminicola]|uniref:Transmembrane protein n=1 Tax=Meloidogyne graminicola TaxID=189291 RepID=A0A8S9ZEK5_9BILA|nr:hypothetical protein Mgra_00008848 [Meloidogyne graminicola]